MVKSETSKLVNLQDILNIVSEERDRLRTRLAEVEADRALEQKATLGWIKENGPGGWINKLREDNKSLLERLKEAEKLLSDAANEHRHRVTPEWLQRRDAFLNPNKDVK